jgi:hypothetical protein
MIHKWYEPFNLSEWAKRTFSLLNLAVFIVTLLFVSSEFRFDWVERLVGSYLSSTNLERPETGAIWETGKHTSDAHEYLNDIIDKKEDVRQTVHMADSFSFLVSSLQPGEWVTLEKEQFKSLYLTLEKSAALKIIEPAQLVWLLKASQLERIFCEGVTDGIKIFFIDADNRVIKQIDLEQEDILEIEAGEKPVPGSLDEMDEFSGRIYSAQSFFKALFKMPADILPDLIADPEALLDLEGKITRVGIWNEARNGYISLGFEFEDKGGLKVAFVKSREWAVWQLSLNLNLNLKGEDN